MAETDEILSRILSATAEQKEPDLTWQEQIQGPARSLASGVTFGFGDELEALLGSALGQGSYDDMLGLVRGERERYAQKVPGVTTALEIAGSLGVPISKIGSLFKGAPAVLACSLKALSKR